MELILDRPVEPLVYALGLRAFGFGSGVIHVLNRQIKLIGVVFDLAAIFRVPFHRFGITTLPRYKSTAAWPGGPTADKISEAAVRHLWVDGRVSSGQN